MNKSNKFFIYTPCQNRRTFILFLLLFILSLSSFSRGGEILPPEDGNKPVAGLSPATNTVQDSPTPDRSSQGNSASFNSGSSLSGTGSQTPAVATASSPRVSVRIKDIATIQGTNENQLIGYGLVVGLNGTGDKSKELSSAMVNNMLDKMGITLSDADVKRLKTKNAAVVMITASLPASFRSGDSIDVTVSSISDATSLEGGVLLFSTLKGPDGKLYASAQGPISVGTPSAGGKAGKNRMLVGTIPDGGIICTDMDTSIVRDGSIVWVLRNPDFNTAVRIADAINKKIPSVKARALDHRMVEVEIAQTLSEPVQLISRMGEISVTPDTPAKVVINERTGTVIMGANVKILPVTVAQGSLTLTVKKNGEKVSPSTSNGLKNNRTASADTRETRTETLVPLGGDATVQDVIDILNYMGVKPQELIIILQSIKNAGALQAELEVI